MVSKPKIKKHNLQTMALGPTCNNPKPLDHKFTISNADAHFLK
jgi:hypothetical protein